MRWSLTLDSPAIVAEPLTKKAALDLLSQGHQTLTLGPDADGRQARVLIRRTNTAIEIAALVTGRADVAIQPPFPEWYNRDHLAVLINPGHDHATRWRYGVLDDGTVERDAAWMVPGEESTDLFSHPLTPLPSRAKGTFERQERHRFFASLRIPAKTLWTDTSGPIGLAIRVGCHDEIIPAPLAWPTPSVWAKDAPLIYGDLYLHEPPMHIERIDIPEPIWGGPPSPVTIHAGLGDDAPRSGHAQIEIVLPGDSEARQPNVPWQANGSDLTLTLPVVFPHRAKWANNILSVAQIRLAFVDGDGEPLWKASYPFAFDSGIIVRERFGPQAKPLPQEPAPDDPDFVDRFRDYVLARIPDYRPESTRDGAPSDFYLHDPDGDAHADMATDDALDRVAAMLATRFPNWQHALCAAAMWVYHPAVTRHSSTWSRVSNEASIDTIPRLGGCFCGDTARLTACLAEKIGQRLNVKMTGYSMGLRGHLGTLVDTPIGRVVIDGMIGLWFHTLDNTRLATLDDMRADRRIAERMWYAPRAHGHEFFYQMTDQMIRPWQSGPLRWPPSKRTP